MVRIAIPYPQEACTCAVHVCGVQAVSVECGNKVLRHCKANLHEISTLMHWSLHMGGGILLHNYPQKYIHFSLQ